MSTGPPDRPEIAGATMYVPNRLRGLYGCCMFPCLDYENTEGLPRHGLPMSDVTRILSAIEQGDPHAAERLLPLVYDELRKLAASRLAQEKPGQTLEATALVHEAYLRLVDVDQAQRWNSRGHFFAAAAESMRRIASAAAAKKWPRLFQCWALSTSTNRIYASWTRAVG